MPVPDPTCPSCEQIIPVELFELHLEGLDGARPECPRTDLVEIVKLARKTDDFWSRLASRIRSHGAEQVLDRLALRFYSVVDINS